MAEEPNNPNPDDSFVGCGCLIFIIMFVIMFVCIVFNVHI